MIYFTGEVSGSSLGWPSHAKEKKIIVASDYIHAPLGSEGIKNPNNQIIDRCRRALKHHTLQVKDLGTRVGGVRQANAIVQRKGDAREPQQQATVMDSPPKEINLISCEPLAHVSDIKLIRNRYYT
ncbi:hypothetical protein NC652_012451 [Populus alba x Populus x berolinensis]|nr:hypothetical protein NC652_012451 [Populus alba x Populus x berolinensis]